MAELTRHARDRARSRHIQPAAIQAALDYGQSRCRRGAEIYTIGWRQVRHFASLGIDLAPWEGIEVVCNHEGRVLTVYRNANDRALRSTSRQPQRRPPRS